MGGWKGLIPTAVVRGNGVREVGVGLFNHHLRVGVGDEGRVLLSNISQSSHFFCPSRCSISLSIILSLSLSISLSLST